MLQLPPKGSHPTLIARRLLLLSSFLQGIPPCSAGELDGLSLDYRTIMSRVFNTATRLVTSNDDFINSLEGIECVMIESMYLNNAGNLRRAWLANRRAMVMAQMIGLHAGTSSPNVILEDKTRTRIDPNCMWFRLVLSDRYLSLMLGLPQGSLDNVFDSPEAPDCCMSVERMERVEAVAAGLILQRNSAERTDLIATYKIDKMLQETAALMSPQWWLMTPSLTESSENYANLLENSIRLMNQFAYHHLLVQLHLPYMMLPSSIDPSYDYSKMTAANASRTIIAQFVSFRKSNLATAYCRGIDFVAFIASTILCLAHIEARRQHRPDNDKILTGFQSIQHQRLSDRGLLEQTLEIMDKMAQSGDVVTQKISSILQPLLDIENNSFRGRCYHVYASSDVPKQDSECFGDTSEAFHALRIQVPYFGTIQIEYRPPFSDTLNQEQILCEEQHWNSVSSTVDTSFVVLRDRVTPLNREKEGRTSSADSPAGYQISTTQPTNPDWQTTPSYLGLTDSSSQSGLANLDRQLSSFDSNEAQQSHLLVPGLSADIDDWTLQGVDMALFSSLTQGSANSTAPRQRN